jgi:hypothetical protein
MTFGPGQFEYASAFSTALNRMRECEDVEMRDKARKALDGLLNSVFPGLKAATRRESTKRGNT